ELAAHLQPLIPDNTDVLAGLELGGVPIATMLSQLSGLPTCFVRKEAKTYGTCKLAEGVDISGKNLLVVEDVVTSGGQVVLSTRDLRNLDARVSQAICVIDRESGGTENLAKEGIELRALFRMSELT
ncbi:MAG: phosphoribosyltransferase family protein, partial [Gemmatimonadota bacterium]|nr:phosphoribosyltransferase family protein [Gemmatimonadota bacterium]